MILTLTRDVPTDHYTLGVLMVNGITRFYTCELPEGNCIPTGTYNVTITFSNRFQRDMPLIENVPGFTGIRIHGGNTAADTEGCVLVGTTRTKDGIMNCAPALTLLQMDIQRELDAGKPVTIEISDAQTN